MGQGGIPNVALVSGGKIVAFKLEHVWVEAWVRRPPVFQWHSALESGG